MPSGCCRENTPKLGQGKGGRSRKTHFGAISIILVGDERTWTGIETVKEKTSDSVCILRMSPQDLLMGRGWRVKSKAEPRLMPQLHAESHSGEDSPCKQEVGGSDARFGARYISGRC